MSEKRQALARTVFLDLPYDCILYITSYFAKPYEVNAIVRTCKMLHRLFFDVSVAGSCLNVVFAFSFPRISIRKRFGRNGTTPLPQVDFPVPKQRRNFLKNFFVNYGKPVFAWEVLTAPFYPFVRIMRLHEGCFRSKTELVCEARLKLLLRFPNVQKMSFFPIPDDEVSVWSGVRRHAYIDMFDIISFTTEKKVLEAAELTTLLLRYISRMRLLRTLEFENGSEFAPYFVHLERLQQVSALSLSVLQYFVKYWKSGEAKVNHNPFTGRQTTTFLYSTDFSRFDGGDGGESKPGGGKEEEEEDPDPVGKPFRALPIDGMVRMRNLKTLTLTCLYPFFLINHRARDSVGERLMNPGAVFDSFIAPMLNSLAKNVLPNISMLNLLVFRGDSGDAGGGREKGGVVSPGMATIYDDVVMDMKVWEDLQKFVKSVHPSSHRHCTVRFQLCLKCMQLHTLDQLTSIQKRAQNTTQGGNNQGRGNHHHNELTIRCHSCLLCRKCGLPMDSKVVECVDCRMSFCNKCTVQCGRPDCGNTKCESCHSSVLKPLMGLYNQSAAVAANQHWRELFDAAFSTRRECYCKELHERLDKWCAACRLIHQCHDPYCSKIKCGICLRKCPKCCSLICCRNQSIKCCCCDIQGCILCISTCRSCSGSFHSEYSAGLTKKRLLDEWRGGQQAAGFPVLNINGNSHLTNKCGALKHRRAIRCDGLSTPSSNGRDLISEFLPINKKRGRNRSRGRQRRCRITLQRTIVLGEIEICSNCYARNEGVVVPEDLEEKNHCVSCDRYFCDQHAQECALCPNMCLNVLHVRTLHKPCLLECTSCHRFVCKRMCGKTLSSCCVCKDEEICCIQCKPTFISKWTHCEVCRKSLCPDCFEMCEKCKKTVCFFNEVKDKKPRKEPLIIFDDAMQCFMDINKDYGWGLDAKECSIRCWLCSRVLCSECSGATESENFGMICKVCAEKVEENEWNDVFTK